MPDRLEEGECFPKFSLNSSLDNVVSDGSIIGRRTIIFIYPKDDTSGCTTECVNFSENRKAFEQMEIKLLGISKDSVQKHKKFSEKHKLEIELLADVDVTLISAVGAWVEKSMYGKSYMGSERTTFLLDENNRILKCWRKVKVKGHVEEVLQTCRAIF